MMQQRYAVGLAALLALWIAPLALADGPHWQVPDPGPPYGLEEEYKRVVENLIKNVTFDAKKAGGGSKNAPKDYYPNPGNFLNFDQVEIDFYQKHMQVLSGKQKVDLPGMKDKKAIYVYIMEKCAQAMREVDDYLPCHDSFPLWHSEAGRELMVYFAQVTWMRAAELPMEYQQPCLRACVDAYVQVLRFAGSEAEKRNEEMRKKLEEAAAAAGANGMQRVPGGMGTIAGTGFLYVTGDIPALTDFGESRMRTALLRIGGPILPYIKEAVIKANNERVSRELKVIYDTITNAHRSPAQTAPPKAQPEPPAEPKKKHEVPSLGNE